MLADKHVHTRFSEDSQCEPEDCVKKAISLGMKELFFTDHYDIDFPGGLFTFDLDDYFETLTRLRDRYKDLIKIHIGVELGLKPDIEDKLQNLISSYPFEYKIGSIHIVDGKDPYYRDEYDMDDELFYRHYFEMALESIKSCSGFDSFGHFEFVVRYGYGRDSVYSQERYSELTEEILKELVKRDIALEVNTAGLRKGLKYPHPYPHVLKKYIELGGRKLTIGSDAHSAKDIGSGFDEALEYVEKLGLSIKDFV